MRQGLIFVVDSNDRDRCVDTNLPGVRLAPAAAAWAQESLRCGQLVDCTRVAVLRDVGGVALVNMNQARLQGHGICARASSPHSAGAFLQKLGHFPA